MIKIIKHLVIILLITLIHSKSFGVSNETLKVGKENAKITIKVFSSLTCPHCANFHINIFETLKKDYIDNGQVKFEHHSFPLDMAALNAEKIVRCTGDVNKRFQLLGEIYKKQNNGP